MNTLIFYTYHSGSLLDKKEIFLFFIFLNTSKTKTFASPLLKNLFLLFITSLILEIS